jgi:hypothetical protein
MSAGAGMGRAIAYDFSAQRQRSLSPLLQPKSGLPDFGINSWPKSGKPDFG